MYVRKYLQVIMQGPRHVFDALPHLPTWLEHQGGTAIGWVSPPLVRHQRGDTYPYVYIYILSVSLSVCSVAAKTRRPFWSAGLSERRNTPVMLSGVCACLSAC